MRSLHERDLGVSEISDRRFEDVGQRYMVHVEEEDELASGHTECVVDVSRFRMRVVRARDIASTHPRREQPKV